MTLARRGALLIVGGLTLLLPSLWATVAAAAPNPPGNNGTVKVEGEALDKLHDNDPHVGCAFFLQWYGFDEGTRTTIVTFDAQPPTGHGDTLLTDTFTFEGSGSGNALDAQKSYDLTDALASFSPSVQGFHVKLTVDTDFSQGADVKHKVFWVSGCAGVGPVEETTTAPTTTEAPTTEVPTTETPTSGELPTEAVSPTTSGGAVLGANEVRQPTSPAAAVLGESQTRSGALARTGSNDAAMFALLGLGLVLVGAALVRIDHRAARAR